MDKAKGQVSTAFGSGLVMLSTETRPLSQSVLTNLLQQAVQTGL